MNTTTPTHTDEINEFITTILRDEAKLDDTDDPEMRLAAALGLQETWNEMDKPEDPGERMLMVFYKLALVGIISSLKLRLSFPSLAGVS